MKKGLFCALWGILAGVLGRAVMSVFVALGRFGGLGCAVGNICHCLPVSYEINEGVRGGSDVKGYL